MEGQILPEFSSSSGLNQKGGYGSPDDQDRLQRGEASYTDMGGSRMSEQLNWIEEPQGPQFSRSSSLPAANTEERERLLRRLHMCAKARGESTVIGSMMFAERDVVKLKMKREEQEAKERYLIQKHDRLDRWGRKLQRNPFSVDLVAEDQRVHEEHRVRNDAEKRRQGLIARRNREAHTAILKRATAEADDLDELRSEKRMLLENEKQLKALRDVEKSNARTAQILQDRRKQQLEKQQAQLMSVVNGQASRSF